MKLKLILEQLASDEMKKIGYQLIPFDKSKIDIFVNWISNFDTTGKAPSGYKKYFDKIKLLKGYVNNIKEFGFIPQPLTATFSYWDKSDIDAIVDNIYSKKNTSSVISELKFGNITYINASLMSASRFKETSNKLNNMLSSLSPFHKKALTGGFTIRFVASNQLRAKAAYKSQIDEIWISETYTRNIDSTKYASLNYIIVHELGHRYEYKVGVPYWFKYNDWNTTKYSMADTMHDGEQFAEIFALSFFGTSQFPELSDKVNSFKEKVGA